MVEDQGGGGFQRRPDVDGATLGAMLRRVLGPRLRVARTPAGVAAQVYRVEVAERVLYVRIAEEDHENLSVDAALLEHLRAEGLHVPPVVHVEPFDQALGRSVLIMGEIVGAPLATVATSAPPAGWPVPPAPSWRCSTVSACRASAGSSVAPSLAAARDLP